MRKKCTNFGPPGSRPRLLLFLYLKFKTVLTTTSPSWGSICVVLFNRSSTLDKGAVQWTNIQRHKPQMCAWLAKDTMNKNSYTQILLTFCTRICGNPDSMDSTADFEQSKKLPKINLSLSLPSSQNFTIFARRLHGRF